MLIDIHAHLNSDELKDKIDEILSKCSIKIINAGVDLDSDIETLELARKYKDIIYPAIGFHPEYIEKAEKEVDKILPLIDKAIAISEVGLDYYWIKDEKLRKKEIEVLSAFLEIGEKSRKPVILHIRGGMNDFLQLVSSYKLTFIIHAFEGSIKIARKILDLGGYLSFPPIIVRDKLRRQIAKEVPIDRLFTETDSPFLGPEKGKMNEPCNVNITLDELSIIKGLSKDEIEKQIEKNFYRVFIQ
ncbi:TatD family deoxyribonuclease [Acidianus infernus]|uniref:TatD family deoxyribonuclease n=1 Tax=Acidianus infernus TaxID=12915 RepID=A0A6A9QNC1_ACIIN|nr:TatD family hydrolase [Acidianus infernus]MCY0873632.1 TatD family hydrolase [Acidianus infernus]MUM64717.1 TatD family deoxyribonuclease [Acidianus infernus]